MEHFYRIADIGFRIVCPDEESHWDHGELAPFFDQSSSAPSWDHTLEFEIVQELPAPDGELVFSSPSKQVYVCGDTQLRYEGAVARSLDGAYLRICRQGNHSQIQLKRTTPLDRITSKIVLNAMEAEHHIVQHQGFLLHASYLRHHDRAILFTAPSGTGKSTQADLWCRLRGAELINGDRAAVMMQDGHAMVKGIPFSGSSRVCKNVSLPLAAIVYLSQAPATTITPLHGVRAFRRVWEGCSVNTWNRDDMELCSQTVLDAVQTVPIFHLACTPDETAVIALEQALENRR